MRIYLALLRKDLKSYFDQPTGYILLVIFVTSLAALEFYSRILISGILSSNQASVLPLMQWLPWVLMLIAPVATMRLVAEELRDGTLEILLTQPLQTWAVILSKFSAGLTFISIGILMTIITPLTLFSAGNPDIGVLVAQYIGSILLAAALVSIGLFASSLTRSQVVPAIGAIFISLILLGIGHPEVALGLPSGWARLLQDISPLTHFLNIVRGTLDVRDVLYFIALTGTFLSGTYLMVRGRTLSHLSPVYNNLRLGVAGLLIASILLGWFGNSIGGRWDLTQDNRFTLAPATEEILDDLEDLLIITVYRSKDPPVNISATDREVRQFLGTFASKSDKVRVVDRYPKSSDEVDPVYQEAVMAGVRPQSFNLQTDDQLQVKTGWLGFTMNYINQRRTVSFVGSLDGLEYRVASYVSAMIREQQDTIGFLGGHGEKIWYQDMATFAGQLDLHYKLVHVEPDVSGHLDLSQIDLLVVPGPTSPLNDSELATIDDFLARGGKAMILVDTTIVDTSTLQIRSSNTNLPQWINRYGVWVHENVAIDLESNRDISFTEQGNTVYFSYPYWVVAPVGGQRDISGAVESMMLPWAASLELNNDPLETNVQKLFELIRTFSSTALQFEYGDARPQTSLSLYQVEQAMTGNHLMAVAVEGVAVDAEPLATGELPPYRMVVIGDADWITEGIIQRAGNDSNLVVAQNWVDWLVQDESLSSIRSKVISERKLRWANDAHREAVKWGNILGLPFVVVLFGISRYIIRRNTTRKEYVREH